MKLLQSSLLACAVVAVLAPIQQGVAQPSPQAQDQPRQIVAEEFVTARPGGARKSSTKPRYTRTKGSASTGGDARLGMTLWRLRPVPADAGADQARLLVQDTAGATAWTAERIDADAPLAMGDRVRLSFESARAGYLYVIDREHYADGTTSDPYLIFPTTRTRGGDNRVEAGRLIEVPDQADRPNYFSVRRSRPDQVAEALTVIVSPTRLEGVTPAGGPQKLAATDVARWERQWGGPVEQLALTGGAAGAWTAVEQRAGTDATRLLTQDDPPPQTVFRIKAAPDAPILVTVRLPYGAGPTPP